MNEDQTILVAGAGGFIGGHLIADLRDLGFTRLRAVDSKPFPQWLQRFRDVDCRVLDLRRASHCREAVNGCEVVYHCAADTGGAAYLASHASRLLENALIDAQLLASAVEVGVSRFFFPSSAFAPDSRSDAALAKLHGERLCRHYSEEHGLETRIARLHPVIGSHCLWRGGREQAVASLCRQAASAQQGGAHTLDIRGSGRQRRPFLPIEDALRGIHLVTGSHHQAPVELGGSDVHSINDIADKVEELCGLALERRYGDEDPSGAGVDRADQEPLLDLFFWQPSASVEEALAAAYHWIRDSLRGGTGKLGSRPPARTQGGRIQILDDRFDPGLSLPA